MYDATLQIDKVWFGLNNLNIVWQVFFTIPELPDASEVCSAHWLFNKSASARDDVYFACSVKPVAPVFLPVAHRHHVCVLQPSSPIEPLVMAALRSGNCWLTIKQIKIISASNRVVAPAQGSGRANKKGVKSVVKVDWARALVSKLFPNETPEEQENIVKGIMGTRASNVSEGNVEQVCNELDLLDDENKHAFSGVKEMADKVRTKLLEAKVRKEIEEGQGRGDLTFANTNTMCYLPPTHKQME